MRPLRGLSSSSEPMRARRSCNISKDIAGCRRWLPRSKFSPSYSKLAARPPTHGICSMTVISALRSERRNNFIARANPAGPAPNIRIVCIYCSSLRNTTKSTMRIVESVHSRSSTRVQQLATSNRTNTGELSQRG